MIWGVLNASEPNVGYQEIAKWIGPLSNHRALLLSLLCIRIPCKVFCKSILKNTYTQILKTSEMLSGGVCVYVHIWCVGYYRAWGKIQRLQVSSLGLTLKWVFFFLPSLEVGWLQYRLLH